MDMFRIVSLFPKNSNLPAKIYIRVQSKNSKRPAMLSVSNNAGRGYLDKLSLTISDSPEIIGTLGSLNGFLNKLKTVESKMQAKETPQPWSEALLATTRAVMNLEFVPRDDFIYLKNINGEYGAIKVRDWLASQLCVQNRETSAETVFSSVDALIAAGWAVD